MKKFICIVFVITTLFVFTIPCFGTSSGYYQETITPVVNWSSISYYHGSWREELGAVETLDFSLAAMKDNDGDGIAERTESTTSFHSDTSSISRIVWMSNVNTIKDLNRQFVWSFNVHFVCGDSDMDFSETFTEIEIGQTGIWYNNPQNDVYLRVWTFDSPGWLDYKYSRINFDYPVLFRTTDLDDGYNDTIVWFKQNARLMSFMDEETGRIVSTWDAFDKSIEQVVIQNDILNSNKIISELSFSNTWLTNTPHAQLILKADPFVIQFPSDGDNFHDTFSFPPDIKLTFPNSLYTSTASVSCTFLVLNKTLESTHTENRWQEWQVGDTLNPYIENNVQHVYTSIPFQAILDGAERYADVSISAGDPILITNLAVIIDYYDNNAESPKYPLYQSPFDPSEFLSYNDSEVSLELSYNANYAEANITAAIRHFTGFSYNTYPTPDDISAIDFVDWIPPAIDGFLNTEIIGFISIGNLLTVVIYIGLFIAILKIFAGG